MSGTITTIAAAGSLICSAIGSALIANAADITGGAGWASFGLVGMILAWLLLRHFPAKDAQIEKLIREKDEQHAQIRAEYRDALNGVLQAGEREIAGLSSDLNRHMDALAAAIEKLSAKIETYRVGDLRRQGGPHD